MVIIAEYSADAMSQPPTDTNMSACLQIFYSNSFTCLYTFSAVKPSFSSSTL